ncbi:protein ARK2N-like isoform X2 [Prinia subflava]|uniref:protein ARK2N-like isoform X2 n=1 Tax=Prinia subflava TaxID=208062 RepID=UPI002FE25C0E
MKMETVGKAELVHSEVPPKTSEKQETAPDEDGPIELETQTQKDNMHAAADSAVLSSMPCLLMELRRDSSESQLASTESDRPMGGRVYESDSSNHCMLSPSSSGHLADSDTLSSAEENEPCQAEAAVEGDPSAMSGATVRRKSRRSRSESETSTMAAKKNRQSSDKQNGRATKVKGHRSQKHKERIRLLRQKREAAARKKYNLLQDSSTSDSDLTCDSSTSSSDDDEEVSGSSKTITAEIPDGPPVIAHCNISDTNSDPEVVNVDNLLAAAVVQEHNNSLVNQDSGSTWRTRGLLDELSADTALMGSVICTKNQGEDLHDALETTSLAGLSFFSWSAVCLQEEDTSFSPLYCSEQQGGRTPSESCFAFK